MSICPPGGPSWTPRPRDRAGDYILFFGTLEPRKNVGALLDAYEQLLARRPSLPDLVLAGRATGAAGDWLARIDRAPLRSRVRHIGYVAASERRRVYEGARLLVQPSFDEGFGLPVLEAMTLGVPVVVSDRGALPELVGEAAPRVNPDDPSAIASAIERMLDDAAFAGSCAETGLSRAQRFSWDRTARETAAAYRAALARRRARAGAA